jgi:hypothetical protein
MASVPYVCKYHLRRPVAAVGEAKDDGGFGREGGGGELRDFLVGVEFDFV